MITIVFVFNNTQIIKFNNINIYITKMSLIAYNKNDFYYSSALQNGFMPTDDDCKAMDKFNKSWDTSCNEQNFENNIDKCIAKELCINKETAELITNIDSRNSGSVQKYENSKTVFNNSLITFLNLGVGVIFLGVLIFKNRKTV